MKNHKVKLGIVSVASLGLTAPLHAQASGYARFSQPSDTIRILGNTVFPGVEWTYEMRIRLDPSMLNAGVVAKIVSEQRDALEDKTVTISGGMLAMSTIRGYSCGDTANWTLSSAITEEWRHLAWVRQADQVAFYIDGVLAQSWQSLPTCTADHPGSWMSIGMFRNGAGWFPSDPFPSFKGDLDWIRISAGARYESAFSPPYECDIMADPQTTLLLKFNEPAGTPLLIDESPNQFVCEPGVPVAPGVVATAPVLGNIEGGFPECDPDGIHSVPSEYPTIQAAINAFPLGTAGIVQVAAGTFNQSFSLNGKDVVVRGSDAHATIIDGTGLTTSIAKFTGGEPATAGLENLVLRNGIAGTIVNPNSPFAAGGALYGLNSSAFIHNCRFESNLARYGGAAYCVNCTLDIADCAFIDNTSLGDAGGIEAFRCAGTITNTLFDGNRSGTKSQAGGSAIKTVGAMTVNGVLTLDGCTMQDGLCIVGGAAIEHYEDAEGVAGVLRIHNCNISNNHSGYDAGGIYNIGRMQACILSGSTSVCGNAEYNIDGPYYLEGNAQACDCLADLTHDGIVNAADLGILLNAWGLTLPSGAGDVNHNGIVDAVDLSTMLSSWGACD